MPLDQSAAAMKLATAEELTRVRGTRPLVHSPPVFSGTLDELWDGYIEPNLPDAETVGDFHRELVAYLHEQRPLLLIRQVRGMERRGEYVTADGTRLKATDNAPAWWVHYALSQRCRIAPEAFARVIETIPAHLFEVSRTMPTSANAAGWHIAHLFAVKDGQTDFRSWRRGEAVGRFIRNVHPCNYGLVPKPEWQRWGGNERVIAFFVERFAERYADVWEEFLRLAQADSTRVSRVIGPVSYAYGAAGEAPSASPAMKQSSLGREGPVNGVARISYPATRLLFKRDIIEALADDDTFEIVTPRGTFAMTKADFYRVYQNVRRSASYRECGVYHYSRLPGSAHQFLVKPAEP